MDNGKQAGLFSSTLAVIGNLAPKTPMCTHVYDVSAAVNYK